MCNVCVSTFYEWKEEWKQQCQDEGVEMWDLLSLTNSSLSGFLSIHKTFKLEKLKTAFYYVPLFNNNGVVFGVGNVF